MGVHEEFRARATITVLVCRKVMIVQGVLASTIEGLVAGETAVVAVRIVMCLLVQAVEELVADATPIVNVVVVLVQLSRREIVLATTNCHCYEYWLGGGGGCPNTPELRFIWLS